MKMMGCMALSFLLLAGCASNPRTKRVEAVQKLQDEVEKLKQTKADKADSNVQLDDFKTELQILSGKIEEDQHTLKILQKGIEKNNERMDRLISDYDKKIMALEEANKKRDEKIAEADKKQEERFADIEKKIEEAHAKKTEKAATSADVKADFSNGMKRFKNKEYASSITLFSRYIQNFPAGKSAKDAQFYLADAYYSKKEYQDAILKFEEYKEKYPKDSHIPEALYKQGISFIELGKKNDAKPFLTEVISHFPDSSFAKKAKGELEKIK